MKGFKEYLHHLPTCNKMQDWSDALDALSMCPDGPDKIMAHEELESKINLCTCALNEVIEKWMGNQNQML